MDVSFDFNLYKKDYTLTLIFVLNLNTFRMHNVKAYIGKVSSQHWQNLGYYQFKVIHIISKVHLCFNENLVITYRYFACVPIIKTLYIYTQITCSIISNGN